MTADELPRAEVASAAPDPLIGTVVGSYRILEMLGSGGMGEVYLALDTRLERRVALKFLHSHFTTDSERVRRFRQEARAASALNHPNILTIHELGEHEGTQFIASEMVEGETLRARLDRGRMDLPDSLRIGSHIASALRSAHAAGVIHRDVKPENIMLRPDGYAKVLDFGIAKLSEPAAPGVNATTALRTVDGMVMGTTRYMSPEQVRGQTVDARTDQWSLGVVLYEMLAGRRPFDAPSEGDVIAAILEKDPPPLDAPETLRSIVARALRKNRDERYKTVDELSADLASFQQELDTGRPRIDKGPRRGVVPLLFAAALLLVLLAAGTIYFRQRPGAPPANHGTSTLAVLPFRALESSSNDEYLALGMADSVITRFAQLRGVIVRPTSSVLKYTRPTTDPIAAGRELRVDSVLEGRFQHLGDRLRVSVQLLNVRDGSSIWAGHFDERYTDVFAVQDAISERVAQALVATLTHEERERMTRRSTENIEAYQLYLRGRYFWERRTAESLRESVDFFQQAIAKDPSYALAHAGLADSYNIMGTLGFLSPDDAFPQAKAAASRALEIDKGLAQAEVARAFATYLYDRDWETAEPRFRHALAEAPNYGPGHQWYAVCLTSRGRFHEAVTEIRRAVQVDPSSLIINAVTCWVLYLARDYDAAIAAANQTIARDGTFVLVHNYLAKVYIAEGRYEEAAVELHKGMTSPGLLGLVLAHQGRTAEARAVLHDLQQQNSQEYSEALVRIGLGEKAEAIALLERAADKHFPWTIHFNIEPALDPLRNEPRFKALLHRIGLPEVTAGARTR